MVQIKTSKGKAHEAKWVSSIMLPDELMIQLSPDERIGDVAPDFDGVETLTITDESGAELTYKGFSELVNATLDESGLTLMVKKRRF